MNIRYSFRLTRDLVGLMNVSPWFYTIPIGCGVIATLLQGTAVGYMMPLAQGIIQRDFLVATKIPIASWFWHLFPWIPQTGLSIFLFLVIAILVATLIKNLFSYISDTFVAMQVAYSTHAIRRLLFDNYLSFGKAYFDRTKLGGDVGKLTSVPQEISNLLISLNRVMRAVLVALLFIYMMFRISWPLTLLALAVMPPLHYLYNFAIRKINALAVIETKAIVDENSFTHNILSCIPLVKSYCMEDAERFRFAEASAAVAKCRIQKDVRLNLIGPIEEVSTIGAIVLFLAITGIVFAYGHATEVSRFIIFFYIFRQTITSLSAVANFQASLASLSGQISVIGDVLHKQDKYIVPDGRMAFRGLRENIQIKNLTFHYSGKTVPALNNVSILIPKGTITAIVGSSGAGKSTLISLLMRFYDCSPNTIFMDDVDIRKFKIARLRRQIAYVSQDPMLLNATLRENLLYGLGEVSKETISRALHQAQLDDLLASLKHGLDTRIGERGVRLSGGEKQRVAIARAMLKGAEILILDEATSSLDTTTEGRVQKAIDALMVGCTTIVIAHRLNTIKKANNIVVLDRGEVVECGALNELLSREGMFYKMWHAQTFWE